MPETCNGCGAPTNPSRTVCEFCGAITAEMKTAADELKVIEELVQLERQKRSAKGSTGFLGLKGQRESNEISLDLWTGSFIPKHPEPLKTLLQVIMSKAMEAGAGTIMKDKFVARANAILATYKLSCADDPNYANVLLMHEAELKKQNGQTLAAQTKTMWKWTIIGFGVVVVLLLSLSHLPPSNNSAIEKCKGEWSDCEQDCRYSNCLQVCAEGADWACTLSEKLSNEVPKSD